MILAIAYDLKGPVGAYTKFFETVRAQGAWSHFIASTWLVQSDRSPREVAETLMPLVKKGDLLLVVEFSPNYWGLMPKEAWDWIAGKFDPQAPPVQPAPRGTGTI
jgi:hypothetical protein